MKKILKKPFIPIHQYVLKNLDKRKFNKALSLSSSDNIKIVVGSSNIYEKGWIPTEMHFLNLLKEEDWAKYFKINSISHILAEHVWEHLTPEEGKIAIGLCYKYLKKDGRLRIAVPDGFHCDKSYIDYVKPGGHGAGADDHKILYTYKTLSTILSNAGFMINLLEYFDENKKFNVNTWEREDGMIHRSIKYDERNVDGKPNYTSLIIDGIK